LFEATEGIRRRFRARRRAPGCCKWPRLRWSKTLFRSLFANFFIQLASHLRSYISRLTLFHQDIAFLISSLFNSSNNPSAHRSASVPSALLMLYVQPSRHPFSSNRLFVLIVTPRLKRCAADRSVEQVCVAIQSYCDVRGAALDEEARSSLRAVISKVDNALRSAISSALSHPLHRCRCRARRRQRLQPPHSR
jgi:hypothetical protein